MSRYDGLIIPRSYSDYINKTDAATLSQALQLSGVMDNAPAAQSTKPAKSGGIFAANAVIMADNATLSGVAISAGSVVRVLFTADLTGSDATTGLTLTYNGNTYAVKVGKDDALVALTAHLIEESFVYLQAYTTLELAFDGTQFIVMGNPVVISNADFCIMADGSTTYTNVGSNNNYIRITDLYTGVMVKNDIRELNLLQSNQGYYLLICSGTYPEATRCTAIIYKGINQTKITIIESSAIELSVNNNKLQIKYNYDYADTEYISLYLLREF